MLFFLPILLFLVVACHCLEITAPDSTTVWLNKVSNNISWTHDSADPANFTITLTTKDANTTILLALVNSTQDFVTVPPPSAGFPVGSGLRIRLVPDTQNLGTVLAQSASFNIVSGTGNSTTSQGTGPNPTPTTVGGTTPQSGSTTTGGAEPTNSKSSSIGGNNALIQSLGCWLAIAVISAALWY